MSEPFLGEIRIVGFNFAMRGWALCDGQILPINQNQSLFALLGTTYGGDGRTTFALPDLRGRTPVHRGSSPVPVSLGERGGEEVHALSAQEMPRHGHVLMANAAAGADDEPAGKLPARADSPVYATGGALVSMSSGAVSVHAGAGQPHANLQPYLVLHFAIALQGVFPSRN